MITDYHVHLETGPYTINWIKEYLLMAKRCGINDLGFSEHGYRFKQSKQILFNPWIKERQTEDIDDYVSLVLNAKKQGLPVKLGIELDYIPGKEKEIEDFLKPYPWDYVIGSVHWLDDWGFDLSEMKDQWESKSIINVYQTYFKVIEELLASKLFDILGHVDVIKVFGHKPDVTDQEKLNRLYDQLVNRIKTSQITVEMSTAGLRKPINELYPAPDLIKRLAAKDIPMIINSDAHHPDQIGEGYSVGIQYLQHYKVNKISTFDRRKRAMVPLGYKKSM